MTARSTIELVCDNGRIWYEEKTGRVFILADDNTSEALQRESRAAADANREIYRLRAKNERFRRLLQQSVIAIESFDELGRELKGCMPDEIRAALGADDE